MYGESPAISPPPPQQQSSENASSQSNQFDYYVSGLPSWKQKLILAKLQRDAATTDVDVGSELSVLATDDDDDLHTGASANRSEGTRLMSPADPVSRAAEHVGAEAEKNGLPNNRAAAELGLLRVSGKSRATASPPPASPLVPAAGAAATAASRHWPVPGSDRRQLSRTGSRSTWYRPPDEIVVVENAAAAGSRGVGWPPSENGPAFAALLPAGSSSDGCQPQPRIGIVHQVVSLIEQQQHQQQQLQLMEAAAAIPKPPPRRKPRQLADGPSADGLASASSPPLSPGVPEPSFIVAAGSAAARPAPLQMPAAARLGPAPFRTPRYEGGGSLEPAAVGINGVFATTYVVPGSAAAPPPLPPRRAVDARISANSITPAAVPPQAQPQVQHRPAVNSNAEVHRVRHVEASSDLEQKAWTAGVARVIVGSGAASRPVAATTAEALAAPAAAGKPHLSIAQVANYPPAQSSLGSATAASTSVNGPVAAATRPPQQQQQRMLSAGAGTGAVSRGSDREERVPEPRPATAGGKALGGRALGAASDESYSVAAQRSQVHAASSFGTAAELSAAGPPAPSSNAARTTGSAAALAISVDPVDGAAAATSSAQRQADVRPTAAASAATTAGLYGLAATPAAASAAIVKREAAAAVVAASGGTSGSQLPVVTAASAPEPSSAAAAAARLTSAAATSATGTTSMLASTAAVSSVASSAAGSPAAGPAAIAAAAAASVPQQQQQSPRVAVVAVKLPSVGATASQSAAGGSTAASSAAASAAQSRSNVVTPAVPSAAASPQPSAHTTVASVKNTTTVVSLKSATTTSSSTDPPAGASTTAAAPRAAGGASGSSASASAPGIRAQPDSRAAASAATPSAGGSDKPGEALEFLQALSRRKAAAAAAAAAATAESDRHPEMGTGRRVFDTRSAMSKERKVPEYEKIFEGKAVVFYNDNVVVGRGNLRKSTSTAKNVKFNSSLLSRMFEYPSEDSLLSSLPKETGSMYYDDAAGAPSKSIAASAASSNSSSSCGDEEEEAPLPTRFGALTLDPNVILEGRPRGSSSHSPHQTQSPPAASSADTSGGALVGLSGSVNEPSNTDC